MSEERIEYYRNLGLKITPQRLAILEYLEKHFTAHPTAEDIYRYVKERFPSMSFATVYNTLEALKERGLVKELYIEEGKKRFDLNVQPHHHFYCTSCGRLIDLHEGVKVEISERFKNKLNILEIRVFFLGICDRCQG
ncbi:MAG TPA: transcriptional repressor [Thermosulfurimonas dismutans]|uniref:Transcriptional repressor n=1 Tax=Thermosulfurimonas dismutans TaxID=999894 RepID=A0A7C3CKX4_9BACT|nr:transcriptional repressor [Thermosulfurimonas dismutans]